LRQTISLAKSDTFVCTTYLPEARPDIAENCTTNREPDDLGNMLEKQDEIIPPIYVAKPNSAKLAKRLMYNIILYQDGCLNFDKAGK
jgi:hypothetical protein